MQRELPEVPGVTAAEVLVHVMDNVSLVLSAVTGYQKQCIDAGFGEGAAEMMAVHLHHSLITAMM